MHTCYSPVRRSPAEKASFLPDAPRLACVKPAASVHPEPGSNSPLLYLVFFPSQNTFGNIPSRKRLPTFVCLDPSVFYQVGILTETVRFPLCSKLGYLRSLAACLGSKMSLFDAFVPESECKVISNFFTVQIFRQKNITRFFYPSIRQHFILLIPNKLGMIFFSIFFSLSFSTAHRFGC